MEKLQLKAQPRSGKGKGVARRVRARGAIPGVLYGNEQEPLNLEVDSYDLKTTLLKAGGMNKLIDLEIPGKPAIAVMLKDYQAHVITREFTHVDFLKIDLNKKVTVEIPIHLVGKAIGTKEGGILEHITRRIKVISLPGSIPDHIDVDVSALNIGDNLHIHDLKLPPGVELVPGVDQTIAAVIMPVVEEEKPPEAAAAEITQPEVLTEKKPAEGEEPAGAKPKPKEEKKEKKEKK